MAIERIGAYDERNIQVLEGLEAVRMRPGMYIGSTDARGLHHLVYEIVDNSIDEAQAGVCDEITITILDGDIVRVVDNGRGIPTGMHPAGKSAVEVCMTKLHAGGKFGGGGYKVSGGLHGVGLSVVNALSDWLEIRVYQNGGVHFQRYHRGKPEADLAVIEQTDITGTRIEFHPDPEIFDEVLFSFDTLKAHLREMAFLNAGLRINLNDEREGGQSRTFHYEGGIVSFVEHINKNKETLFDTPIYLSGVRGTTSIEVAMQYNDTYAENVFTFANTINTQEGGTHLEGFRRALTRVVNDYGKKYAIIKTDEQKLAGEDIREGLSAVISVKLEEPQFEGQTKTKLGNAEVRQMVDSVVSEGLQTYLEENPQTSRIILDRCMMAARAREAARKARELAHKKSGMEASTLPGKLWDCTERDPANCEIFIVEGNSAGGSAKGGRDRAFQAILPLRGKILNVEKTRIDRMLQNNEIRTMITAFGAGIGEDFNLEKLRYHSIVCMTDADVDGSHIRILLLTFFYRYMRPLIEAGYVYIAQPPLYKVTKGKTERYLYSDEQLRAYLDEIGGEPTVQRYKGLGEMNAEQLWETTMNPETRTMLRVNLEDALSADAMFDMLMGDRVEPRRLFIEEHAKDVANLDV